MVLGTLAATKYLQPNTCNQNLEVIQTWFNSGSGKEVGVSQLRQPQTLDPEG
jgi:hypothetical protein